MRPVADAQVAGTNDAAESDMASRLPGGRVHGTVSNGITVVLDGGTAWGATTFFVNSATGSDANDCLSAAVGASPVGPCLTVLPPAARSRSARSEGPDLERGAHDDE